MHIIHNIQENISSTLEFFVSLHTAQAYVCSPSRAKPFGNSNIQRIDVRYLMKVKIDSFADAAYFTTGPGTAALIPCRRFHAVRQVSATSSGVLRYRRQARRRQRYAGRLRLAQHAGETCAPLAPGVGVPGPVPEQSMARRVRAMRCHPGQGYGVHWFTQHAYCPR